MCRRLSSSRPGDHMTQTVAIRPPSRRLPAPPDTPPNLNRPDAECLAAHAALYERAHRLGVQLTQVGPEEADALRIAATCIRIASHRAFTSRDERSALRD